LSCYHIPELFKKNGGEVKDSDFEFPEYQEVHYKHAIETFITHWVNIVFYDDSKIEREKFYKGVKTRMCKD
jgi:hypothetical protein